MEQDKLQSLLDSLDEGVLGTRTEQGWDTSRRNKYNNAAKCPEARAKMSAKAKARNKDGWASPNRFEWTTDNCPNKGGNKGEENPTYGKGKIYKELTTGFEGIYSEMTTQFPGFDLGLVGRKRIRVDSKYPNLKFIALTEDGVKGRDIVVHFTPEQVAEIKERYVSDISLSAKDLGKEYNVNYQVITTALSNGSVYEDSEKYGAPVEVRRFPIHTCPHCGIQTGGSNYGRWHGDNCKKKVA